MASSDRRAMPIALCPEYHRLTVQGVLRTLVCAGWRDELMIDACFGCVYHAGGRQRDAEETGAKGVARLGNSR
jgi:hypothetical protein